MACKTDRQLSLACRHGQRSSQEPARAFSMPLSLSRRLTTRAQRSDASRRARRDRPGAPRLQPRMAPTEKALAQPVHPRLPRGRLLGRRAVRDAIGNAGAKKTGATPHPSCNLRRQAREKQLGHTKNDQLPPFHRNRTCTTPTVRLARSPPRRTQSQPTSTPRLSRLRPEAATPALTPASRLERYTLAIKRTIACARNPLTQNPQSHFCDTAPRQNP